MWINREIWQRALRSNRAPGVRGIRIVLSVFLFLTTSVLGAQERDLRAYLIEQPRYSRSMESFPANRIANYEARYQVGDEFMRVFVATPDRQPVDFIAGDCAFAPTETWNGTPADTEMIRYTGDAGSGYDVYVLVPADAPWSCAALEQFVLDFAFFASIDRGIQEALRRVSVDSPTRVPGGVMQFPAILELNIP